MMLDAKNLIILIDMLVFFIHGVNTKDASYADVLIKKVKESIACQNQPITTYFYSGYWGNLFNNKKQHTISCIEKDLALACYRHQEYNIFSYDIYRYTDHRYEFLNNFLSDFLIYQNPKRGAEIRKILYQQLEQFLLDHAKEKEIHFIAHSLGSIILYDLLFSNNLPEQDYGYYFRNKLKEHRIRSITTMGSPLLFLKQMMDLDFSTINDYTNKLTSIKSKNHHVYKLMWVNLIHASDMIAYPLKTAIKNEISSDILFFDQYIWQDGNAQEKGLRTIGSLDLAMIVGASDAHCSYFANNQNGSITARIITYNLLGETLMLFNRRVTPK